MKIRRVLAFEIPIMKNLALAKLCHDMGVEFTLVDKNNYHKSIGFLCKVVGISEKPEEDKNEACGEMLVFAGFNSEDLEFFLSKYKLWNSESIPLKAMITEYNVLWSPTFLYSELKKEKAQRG
ncbi:MAG: DUF3783 domain-containing protein [Treponema sp.]|nr:DUF3783 domain-containing protein [Treponema sp.]